MAPSGRSRTIALETVSKDEEFLLGINSKWDNSSGEEGGGRSQEGGAREYWLLASVFTPHPSPLTLHPTPPKPSGQANSLGVASPTPFLNAVRLYTPTSVTRHKGNHKGLPLRIQINIGHPALGRAGFEVPIWDFPVDTS